MRLGFRVERFIGSDLKNKNHIKILAENTQIRNNKQTIGELDCLLLENGRPIHLEIIYKLYLYDETVGTTELEHWIGGNRRDSLSKKLHKLIKKQLPLLYSPYSRPLLDSFNLKAEDIEQRVHFRAQLFVPQKSDVKFEVLNKDCLKGFYIRPEQLNRLRDYLFYIPLKRDWLVEPQNDVSWMGFAKFKEIIDSAIPFKSYPLCWIKYLDGSLAKFFVVWWD